MDADARKAYVQKFLGFDDGKSSSRVLEAVDDLMRSPSSSADSTEGDN